MEYLLYALSILISFLVIAWTITIIDDKIKFKKSCIYSIIYVLILFITQILLNYFGIEEIYGFLLALLLGGISLFLTGKYVLKDKNMKGTQILWIIFLGGLLIGAVSKGIWTFAMGIGFIVGGSM